MILAVLHREGGGLTSVLRCESPDGRSLSPAGPCSEGGVLYFVFYVNVLFFCLFVCFFFFFLFCFFVFQTEGDRERENERERERERER